MKILELIIVNDEKEETQTQNQTYRNLNIDTEFVKYGEVISLETLKKYDALFINNDSFEINSEMLLDNLHTLLEQKMHYIQYTLRQASNFEELKRKHYRELYSSILININNSLLNNEIKIEELFFQTRFQKKNYKLIETKYIGEKTTSLLHYSILINHLMTLFNNINYNEIRLVFKNDKELMYLLNDIINNRVFEMQITQEEQYKFFDSIQNFLKHIPEFKIKSKNELYLMYKFIEEGYYELALRTLFLHRSRKYWLNTSRKMKIKYGENLNDIRHSDSWKTTQKFRNIRKKLSEFYNYSLEKLCLKMLSFSRCAFLHKEKWILAERLDSANDNAYELFKYIHCHEKSVKPYYLINKQDFKLHPELKQFGKNIVFFGTLRHKLLMLEAKRLVTSFTIEENIIPFNPNLYKELYKNELSKKIKISIQHGMIINNISPYLHKKNYLIDYITANNNLEKQIIINTLGYNSQEVILSSMPRLDKLQEKNNSNQILLMPTWKRGLQTLNINQFSRTEYFSKLKELLIDEQLYQFLIKNNLYLKLVLHPMLSKHTSLFSNLGKERILISNIENENISKLIRTSKVLITDFSSIAIDFLYQGKNAIFYQYNKLSNHHVSTNEIPYEILGPVVINKEEVIQTLKHLVNTNYRLDKKYQKTEKTLFSVRKNHAKTAFENIKKLK